MFYNTAFAYVLWLVGGCGILGLHRIYLKKYPTAILWMVSGGLGGIGAIYDLFTLPGQVREANIKAGYRAGISGGPAQPVFLGDFPDARPRDSMEKAILKVARRNGGTVSPGEVALDSDYSSDEARRALEQMAGKGMCEMRVRPSGVIVFRFPEFSREDEGFEPGL